MEAHKFQLVSGLYLNDTVGVAFGRVLTPVAPFLLLAGNIADPTTPLFLRFLQWASQRWERIWLVMGELECRAELECRKAAAQLYNVCLLTCSVDFGVPGMFIAGSSGTLPHEVQWLAQNATRKTLILSHVAPPQQHTALQWAHGDSNCTWGVSNVCPWKRPVIFSERQQATAKELYDTSFYFMVRVPPGTYMFTRGSDPFPSARFAPIESRPHTVCYFCGHSGHVKTACPIVQCSRCGHFGHMERSCLVK